MVFAIAAIVGWVAAEFFIPALMELFEFGVYTALAIAFFIGYSGIRLLPHLETQVFKRLDKVIGGTEEDKDKIVSIYKPKKHLFKHSPIPIYYNYRLIRVRKIFSCI